LGQPFVDESTASDASYLAPAGALLSPPLREQVLKSDSDRVERFGKGSAVRDRTLPLNRGERAVVLTVGDAAAAVLACLLANSLWSAAVGRHLSLPVVGCFIFAAAWVAALFSVDGYGLKVPEGRVDTGVVVLKALPMVTFVGVLYFFAEPYRITRPVITLSIVLGVFAVIGGRLSILWMLSSKRFAKRALLVGGGPLVPTLPEALRGARAEYSIVGSVGTPDGELLGLTRFGPSDDLPAVLRANHIDEVILGTSDPELISQIVERCFVQGIRVQAASALIERYYGRVPLDAVNAEWFLYLPGHDLMARPYPIIRRAVDLFLSAAISVPFMLLMPFLAFLIKVDSAGPVFFTQYRVGQHGRIFRLIKLRTMIADAEAAGSRWAAPGDSRVTRVGRALRACRIDEVPQVFNVLRGEMSFIGPRPEQPELVSVLERAVPHYQARHSVKPGISGWAQVKNGYASSVSETARKLEYDLYYVKHQSLRLDLQIVFHTLFTVLRLRGR
jgi:exopolysaccharide biosynthesis polyprenyl glycosylphosphotransferase